MQNLAADSTVHGINYIFGENRSKFSRVFWTLLFLTSTGGFLFYAHINYVKWQYSPEIAIRRIEKNASEFPMAALSYCARIIPIKHLPDDLHTNKNLSMTDCKTFGASNHFCYDEYSMPIDKQCSDYLLKELKGE